MQKKRHDEAAKPAQLTDNLPALLLVLVAIAFALSQVQRLTLDFRAGHMDEYDYLFVGKMFLHGMDWPTYTYIFGSNFNWYIFGAADKWLGGLTGARIVAAFFGLVSLFGVYMFALALWRSRRIALTATLLLAAHSNHIFISKVATYDSVSFALFSLSLAPLIHGIRTQTQHSGNFQSICLIITGSLLILFSGLAKYTTLAYLPFIATAILWTSCRAGFVFCGIVGFGLATHCMAQWSELQTLYAIQINGVHEPNASYIEILSRCLNHTGLLLLPSLLAIVIARSMPVETKRCHFYRLCSLLVFGLPLVLYHLHSRNLISLYKHLNYANLFLCVSTAWLVNYVIHKYQQRKKANIFHRNAVLTAGLSCYLILNIISLDQIQRGYPDLTSLLRYLKLHEFSGSVLSENPYLFRYLKFGELPQEQIKETSWLDNDQDGQYTYQDKRCDLG